jgi:L-ascorbate metabolism protein UlaG (beta-lactamase superfamily)
MDRVAAHGAGKHEQDDRGGPEQRLEPDGRVGVRVEVLAERAERSDGRKRDGEQDGVECQVMRARRIGKGGDDHECGRQESACHRRIASPPGRTVLLDLEKSAYSPGMATLTWLGHSAFRIESDRGKRIYIDPFLTGNPKTPEHERTPERVDVIAITHGHSDHVGDAVALSSAFDTKIVCQVELKGWLDNQGARLDGLPGINKGGSQEIDGIRFSLVNAFHSSSSNEGEYLGEAGGIVVRLEAGKTIYFAGDTCVFGDMALIARIHHPDVAVLPIGDWFTMSPKEAAVALELLGNPRCVPCHWGTFPLLTGTPEALAREAPGATIEHLDPGDSVEL